jgi:DeoR/GlpR family transcriptional regulator of sugar metabolism
LVRTHGGAEALPESRLSVDPPVLDRTNEQGESKSKIAGHVATLIKDGETVFLGSGTTTLAVAMALAGRRNLTVVTNALTIANALATNPAIDLVLIGGFLRHSELSLVGHIAEAAIRDVRVDKVIIGIRGINLEHGLTNENMQELMTDRSIMGMSDTLIVVADHTKFGQVSTIRLGPVTAASLIVTDTGVPTEMVAQLHELGVKVTIVE